MKPTSFSTLKRNPTDFSQLAKQMRFWTTARQTLQLCLTETLARVDFDFNQRVYKIKHQMETLLGRKITKKDQVSFVEFMNSEEYLKQPLQIQIQFVRDVYNLETRRTLMIHLLYQKFSSASEPLELDTKQFQTEYNNLIMRKKFLNIFKGSKFGIPNAFLESDKMYFLPHDLD